jgi:hypothetical protein
MSTVIVGAGISGLATAIFIKESSPREDVAILYDGGSNSSISGNRFRSGADNKPDDLQAMIDAISSREYGADNTNQVIDFCILGRTALERFSRIDGLSAHYDPCWFGPKITSSFADKNHRAPAPNTLNYLKGLASDKGVRIARYAVTSLNHSASSGWQCRTDRGPLITSDRVVLASGSPCGRAFGPDSTNRSISGSAVELVLGEKIEGIDESSIHGVGNIMLHPFGKLSPDGTSVVGCYATDSISDTEVYTEGKRNYYIEEMLRLHTAHSSFPEIIGKVGLEGANYFVKEGVKHPFAPAVHYWHVGLKPEGSYIEMLPGLFVAGESGNTIRYFDSERLPGTALTMCLADAHQISEYVHEQSDGASNSITWEHQDSGVPPKPKLTDHESKKIKALQKLNSRLVFGSDRKTTHYTAIEEVECFDKGLAEISKLLISSY